MKADLHRHEQLSDHSRLNVVAVLVAHRTLKRYFAGHHTILEQLNPTVANWLEDHGFIEGVLSEENELHFQVTPKAKRAMLAAA